jgi:hypothetical protein
MESQGHKESLEHGFHGGHDNVKPQKKFPSKVVSWQNNFYPKEKSDPKNFYDHVASSCRPGAATFCSNTIM